MGQCPRRRAFGPTIFARSRPRLRTIAMTVNFGRIENLRRIIITQSHTAGHGGADSAAGCAPPANSPARAQPKRKRDAEPIFAS